PFPDPDSCAPCRRGNHPAFPNPNENCIPGSSAAPASWRWRVLPWRRSSVLRWRRLTERRGRILEGTCRKLLLINVDGFSPRKFFRRIGIRWLPKHIATPNVNARRKFFHFFVKFLFSDK